MRLRSRRPIVPGARNLLDNLARLGIRASEWTNHKWNAEYCESASRLRAFVPGTSVRPVGMGLPRAAWVKLNRLRTGVGRFHSSMHKWVLAPSPNCECGASEQTADHVLTVTANPLIWWSLFCFQYNYYIRVTYIISISVRNWLFYFWNHMLVTGPHGNRR